MTKEMSADSFRRRLFGSAAVDAHLAGATESLAPELNRLMDSALFAGVWQWPGLELKWRSLVTISAMAAVGRERELEHHILGGLRAGLGKDEIVQAIVHLAFYCGLPATHAGLRVALRAFAKWDEDQPGGLE